GSSAVVAARNTFVVPPANGAAACLPPFPSGWPAHQFEEHAGMAQVAQSQLFSIVSEGVFDLFPESRVSVVECGFTWLPALMWRFDKGGRGPRRRGAWGGRGPAALHSQKIGLSG